VSPIYSRHGDRRVEEDASHIFFEEMFIDHPLQIPFSVFVLIFDIIVAVV
jgi:hypothetical protein